MSLTQESSDHSRLNAKPESERTPANTASEELSRSGGSYWAGPGKSVFSFPIMCMFLIAGVIFAYSARGITEPDIWWHLRNASHLLQYHSLPLVDTYSLTAAGSPLINPEWLSELPFFFAYQTAALRGLLFLYFTVVVLIFTGVYYRSWRAGADCKDAAVATLAGVCLAGVSLAPRMLLFGWLCMEILLLVLDHFRRSGRGLWILPLLFGFWINLHGSWVFGGIVLALTVASGLVEGEWGLVLAPRWSSAELRRLLLASIASVAALFLNPYGYKLVFYPYELLLRHNGVMQHLEEWQPVNFSAWNGKLALILIFGLLAAPLFSRRRWRLDEVLLTGFALWAAVSHVRFFFFAGMIIMPILAPRLKLFPPYRREIDKPWLNAGIMAAALAAFIIFLPKETHLQQKVDQQFPSGALAFMHRQNLNGRIFNPYAWGGYIVWNAPELKTFIDGRADIFIYNGVFADFLKATALTKSFQILDKHKIQYVLIPPARPLGYLLEHSPDWRLIYSDKVAVLFERAAPTAASATSSATQSSSQE